MTTEPPKGITDSEIIRTVIAAVLNSPSGVETLLLLAGTEQFNNPTFRREAAFAIAEFYREPWAAE